MKHQTTSTRSSSCRWRAARLLVIAGAFCCAINAPAAGLQVEILPRFNGAPLIFDSVANRTSAGQLISVTRLDFLVSNFALKREDGSWLGLINWQAYVNTREGRTSFALPPIPSGRYEVVPFLVGLTPELNHADAAQYPAEHPLNPNLDGLHWGWQGGYVFMALEGRWVDGGAQKLLPEVGSAEAIERGYSFHIANDPQLMTVEIPIVLELNADHSLRLALNVAKIFEAQNTIQLSDNNSTTHSRSGDLVASKLCHNIERAFLVESFTPTQISLAQPARVEALVASDATPYKLVISSSFPRPALPLDNPITEEGVALGRRLFFDPHLSINNSQSCASCHQIGAGLAEHKPVSTGAEGQVGTRNAMQLFNLAWKSAFFWDGRAASLREQVLQPIQNPVEVHETLTNLVAKLIGNYDRIAPPGTLVAESKSTYPIMFAHAFGTSEINADRIARALEQFLLTQTSHNSKFDRVIAGLAAFTSEEQRGFELFHTEYDPRREQYGADCFHCHGGPLFQNMAFANNGLDSEPKDLGRFLVTGKLGDNGKFAVPSLRNVELTAPYMHDGRFATLKQVVEHYSTGLKRSSTLDPSLAKHPGSGGPLSKPDKKALVAFLKTLTDERFKNDPNQIAKAL